jgi:hypothetical protein
VGPETQDQEMQEGLTSMHMGARAFQVTLLILRLALGGLFLEAGTVRPHSALGGLAPQEFMELAGRR